MKELLLPLAGLALVSSPTLAQDSGVIMIGGPGSCGSNGSSDPGTLDDDVTEATGRLEFTLDSLAGTLTLVVENTSPVLPGVPNPILTDIYFNAPSAITEMTLQSQSGSGGATPSYSLSFDPDTSAKPNPNKSSGFGVFSACLENGRGVSGGIANPSADTYGVPEGSFVIGPVTFVFSLSGDLSGLSSDDFVNLLSVLPPGSKAQTGVVKFQAGGELEASGSIGPMGNFCPVVAQAIDLGGGCGNASMHVTPPVMGGMCIVTITGAAPDQCGTLFTSQPGAMPTLFNGCQVFLNLSTMYRIATFVTDASGMAVVQIPVSSYEASPGCCDAQMIGQAALFSKSPTGKSISDITNAWHIVLGS